MTTLTTEQRFEVWAEIMDWLSRQGISVALTKSEIADAVAALDAGIGQSVGMVDAFLGAVLAMRLEVGI